MCNEEGLKHYKENNRVQSGKKKEARRVFLWLSSEPRVWTVKHPTLPEPPHHSPSYSDWRGCHCHPSWSGCATDYRPHHRSSSPDHELSPCHANQAECSSGCRLHYNPRPLGPLLGTGHHHARVPALQWPVCAMRLGVVEHCDGFGSKRKHRWTDWKAGVQCKVGPIWMGRVDNVY